MLAMSQGSTPPLLQNSKPIKIHMKLRQYQVDAFATHVFEGNPAAVCPLDQWLDDTTLQAIAAENNLAETAFIVPEHDGYALRWFTPVTEVDLCGHATLASAYVLYEILDHPPRPIAFQTRSGTLTVRRSGALLEMDFPTILPQQCTPPQDLVRGLGVEPQAILSATDYIVVLNSEAAVRALMPDLSILATLNLRGVCVTAPGDAVDFVSRFFAPKAGIPEDPVTGSAHCELAPYWAQRLGRTRLRARQISKRGGDVRCTVVGDRTFLAGSAVVFMHADIFI